MEDVSRLLGEEMGRRLHEAMLNPKPAAHPTGVRAWLIRMARRLETWHDGQSRAWDDIASRLER